MNLNTAHYHQMASGKALGRFALALAAVVVLSACLLTPSVDGATYDGELTLYGYNIHMGLQQPDQVSTVEWDFGDGSETVTVTLTADNSNGSVDHLYTAKGDYVVTATMRNTYTDDTGSHEGETVLTYLYHIMGYPVVTFVSNGGSSVDPIEGTSSMYVPERPADPVKDGSTFSGWYVDAECTTLFDWNSTIAAHTTLYAGWDLVTYTVIFDLNGGTGTISNQNIAQNGTVTAPAEPSRTGFVFLGWFLNGNEYDFNVPVTSNMTLVAKWTEVDPAKTYYKVVFDGDGGTPGKEFENVLDGNFVVLPSAQRDGYRFDGWYSGSQLIGQSGDSVKVTSNMTLVAHWTAVEDSKELKDYIPFILIGLGVILALVAVAIGFIYLGIPATILVVVGLLMLLKVIQI